MTTQIKLRVVGVVHLPIILMACLSSAFAAHPNITVGSTWWLASKNTAIEEIIGGSKWFTITGDATDDPYDYIIRLSTGKSTTIRKLVVREAVESQLLVPYDPEVKKRQEAAAAKAAANAARAAHVATVRLKKWPQDIEKAVLDGKVKIGMTEEQVSFAWGKPSKVNRTIGRWGTHEQWVYSNAYLYFENGILTALQDSR